jgi:exopolysaccharide biosynthesis WecB/TagA/CpsF family protein
LKISNFDLNSLDDHGKHIYSFVNPYSYYMIVDYPDSDNFTFFADGILLVKLHNLLSKEKISRFSFDFTSLAPVIFKFAIEKKYKVALVGGSADDIIKAKRLLSKKYKGLSIVYSHDGYLQDNKETVLKELSSFSPEVIICGMGTPLQEGFINDCYMQIDSMRLGFTCGGFISQIAENENYFHPFFDKLHLRWFQRFLRHGYVRKRVLIDYPIFLIKYIKEKLSR